MQEGLGIVKGAVGITFNESRVWFWALMMLLVIIMSIVVTIISGYLESKISAGFAVKLRDATYKKNSILFFTRGRSFYNIIFNYKNNQ